MLDQQPENGQRLFIVLLIVVLGCTRQQRLLLLYYIIDVPCPSPYVSRASAILGACRAGSFRKMMLRRCGRPLYVCLSTECAKGARSKFCLPKTQRIVRDSFFHALDCPFMHFNGYNVGVVIWLCLRAIGIGVTKKPALSVQQLMFCDITKYFCHLGRYKRKGKS